MMIIIMIMMMMMMMMMMMVMKRRARMMTTEYPVKLCREGSPIKATVGPSLSSLLHRSTVVQT